MTPTATPPAGTSPILYIGDRICAESAAIWESELLDYATGASANQRLTMVINTTGGNYAATQRFLGVMKECQQLGFKIHAHILNAESGGADIAFQADTRSAGREAKLTLHAIGANWQSDPTWNYWRGIITHDELEMRERRVAECISNGFHQRVEHLSTLIAERAAPLADKARESLMESCWLEPSLECWQQAGAIDCLVDRSLFRLCHHAYMPRELPLLSSLVDGFQLPDNTREDPIWLLDGEFVHDKKSLEILDEVLCQQPVALRIVLRCQGGTLRSIHQVVQRLAQYQARGGRIYMKVYQACGGVAHLAMLADEVEMARTCHYELQELVSTYESSQVHADRVAGKAPFEAMRKAWEQCHRIPKPHAPRNLKGIIDKSQTAEQCLELGACSRIIG